MKTSRLTLAALLVLVAGVSPAAAKKNLAPQPYYGVIAQKVIKVLTRSHLLQLPFDDDASRKAWTNLVTSFDPDRCYFLKSDIESFEPMQTQIDDALKSGDVSFAYNVHRVFLKRMEERYTFVTNLLTRPFDYSVNESYTWKRKDAAWPATLAEQNDLWRKRVKNECLSGLIGRELDAIDASNALKKASAKKAPTTNTVAKAKGATNSIPVLTTEQNIAKRYKQYVIIFEDMDEETILQRYLSAAMMAYDPHSDYMSPMRKEDFDIDMNLSLCGIGATLQSEDGAAKVRDLIPGGPADRDKRDIRLMPNDKIIGVGQGDGPIEDIVHWPLNKAVRKIRGPKGTRVVLEVIPATDPSGTTTKRVDIVRDEIKLEEQAATGHVERVTLPDGSPMKIGIIRLPAFYGTMDKRPGQPGYRSATIDVAKIIANMNNEAVEGLILDLRNNGGGSLREAIDLTGLFICSGPAVQVREPRRVSVLQVPKLDTAMAFRKPMIVMINRASASASEIVAGALQDYGRAVMVGDTQTHGKGTVQTVSALGDETYGSVKITTASFYRITGSSTQSKGVRSDIVIPSVLDGLDLGEDKLPNALPWSQIDPASYIPVADMKAFIPKLKALSAARLATNKQYTAYCSLVRHTKELSEQTTVPLEINARRKQMIAEREMRKAEDSAFEDPLVPATDKKKDEDIVLDETQHILANLVLLMGRGDIPMETEGDLRARMLRIFGQW